ncbi:MAG: hypothetical protein EOT05_01865 [Candidatus Microsaccharimonas sossegonensis]|uniref:Uncharacterized protein n=1 Tax=Candidatus Microsaccharimonas sossegonensis TaxID=2506948 RepID=A0A4Q0AHB4_9BACT|nr:MAG: hypothetical protein EOT05_01865 [Candidatus Microsaccharimonas sossegonensis]
MGNEEYLDGVELKESKNSEVLLLELGLLLYESLINSETLPEVELLVGVVLEYSQMVSQYADKTGRLQESLAVDLNEAVQFKRTLLTEGESADDWMVYANGFKANLMSAAQDLEVNL